MVLRQDERQWLIYNPHTVEQVFKVVEAAGLIALGAFLQKRAPNLPSALRDNVGTLGVLADRFGEARQEIQAGLAPNAVSDDLVVSQRGWDVFARWLRDPSSVPLEEVADVMDQITAAMVYLDEKTHSTGTNHPRWNSRLISGEPCKECGR